MPTKTAKTTKTAMTAKTAKSATTAKATSTKAAAAHVTRAQVLAYRAHVQGLDRPGTAVGDLDVWALGLQDTPSGAAALSLAARLPGGAADVPDLADARSWVTAWATRGAPLVVRAGDVDAFTRALWPLDDDDAATRLAGNGQQLKKAGEAPLEALRVTATAMHAVVDELAAGDAVAKGEVSGEVSRRLPEAYITWCRPCQAHHLGDQLMRLAGLPGGVRLVHGADKATLAPLARWPGVPEAQEGADRLVRAYLHLLGPATPAAVASFLGTTQKAVRPSWPSDDVVAVDVDGGSAWILAEDLEALVGSPAPDHVRLLPRCDPWMLARDRELIVPDKAAHKVLWPVLGAPGALLVGGEVRAAWRTKASGKRLDLAVQPLGGAGAPRGKLRQALEEEAAHVARLRGADDVRVTVAET